MTECLKEKCCGYSKEAQLTTLCWALASVYQTLLYIMKHSQREERENTPTGFAATLTPMTGTAVTLNPATGAVCTPTVVAGAVVAPTPMTGTANEPKNKPLPVSVAPIHKRKSWKRKSPYLVRDEEDSPKSEQKEEAFCPTSEEEHYFEVGPSRE